MMKMKLKIRKLFQNLSKDKRILRMKNYIQHGNVTTYAHCCRVAKLSYTLCCLFGIQKNRVSVVRAAFLHDYYLYDWHTYGDKLHGFHHPKIAAQNARRDFAINKLEEHIIVTHMWPLTFFHIPRTAEAAIVCIADKICSIEESIRRW